MTRKNQTGIRIEKIKLTKAVSQHLAIAAKCFSIFSGCTRRGNRHAFSVYEACRTPRQLGKFEQPQNIPPALAPLRAVLITIPAPHCGQAVSTTAVGWAIACLFSGGLTAADMDCFACLIMEKSLGPSTNCTLRPSAKALASAVKRPAVTTNPPVAPPGCHHPILQADSYHCKFWQ